MTDYLEYKEIYEEAYQRFRDFLKKRVTQDIREEDCLDFWVYLVTKEKLSS